MVVGGGDSAIEEGTYLPKYASKVHLVHRRDTLRASKAMQDRLFSNPKITPAWFSEVVEVLGDKKVEGVKIKDVRTGAVRTQPCAGLFLAIGHQPNTAFLAGQVKLDEKGYVHPEGKDADLRRGRLRLRRRGRPRLPPGHHGRRHGLCVRPGRRTLARGAGQPFLRNPAGAGPLLRPLHRRASTPSWPAWSPG